MWCAGAPNTELSAMAAARLHFLIQTRPETDLEETAYLLHELNRLAYQAVHRKYHVCRLNEGKQAV